MKTGLSIAHEQDTLRRRVRGASVNSSPVRHRPGAYSLGRSAPLSEYDEMDQFKARKTIYNGIQMRSRLEARVAAWLDKMGVRWTYEPNAFGSQRGQYLPDFEFHRPADRDRPTFAPMFLEVKGEVPDGGAWDRDLLRMKTILQSHPNAVLLMGFPDEMERDGSVYGWNYPGHDDEVADERSEFMRWQSIPIVWPLTRLGFVDMCDHWRLPRWNE